MDQAKLEAGLKELPLLQYEWFRPDELTFSTRIRQVCENECPMYGKTWACPPAVGPVSQCREICLGYERALLISTVTEVRDIADMEETLATRAEHEAITRQTAQLLRDCGAAAVYVLSTEACALCKHCTYPDGPCRHPEHMFPCVESHGIVVTDLAERYGIEFLAGNAVVWFSLLFYKD